MAEAYLRQYLPSTEYQTLMREEPGAKTNNTVRIISPCSSHFESSHCISSCAGTHYCFINVQMFVQKVMWWFHNLNNLCTKFTQHVITSIHNHTVNSSITAFWQSLRVPVQLMMRNTTWWGCCAYNVLFRKILIVGSYRKYSHKFMSALGLYSHRSLIYQCRCFMHYVKTSVYFLTYLLDNPK